MSESEEQLLCQSTVKSCPLFSLQGRVMLAKVVDVYDGDTCDIVLIYQGMPHHFKARMFGYDAPEMKPSLKEANREQIKARAKEAKRRLVELVTNGADSIDAHQHLIQIMCGDFDKYGRLLVTAFPRECDVHNKTMDECFPQSFNHRMIQEGHGYAYYGGTKQV